MRKSSTGEQMKTYYKRGQLEVTQEFVKTRTRSIQLETIESVELFRPMFWIGLSICGGLIGIGLVFGDLLHGYERDLMVGGAAAVLLGTWQIGTLSVQSKLTAQKGWSVIGWHKRLREMRLAIETAMTDREDRRRNRGGTVTATEHGVGDDQVGSET